MESSVKRFKIVPILEDFGAGARVGSSKILCPFHDDNIASGWHNDYYFKCFACGVQGDAVGLLHRQGELSWSDAYQRAKDLAGEPDSPVSDTPVSRSRVPGQQRNYRGHSRYGKTGSGR